MQNFVPFCPFAEPCDPGTNIIPLLIIAGSVSTQFPSDSVYPLGHAQIVWQDQLTQSAVHALYVGYIPELPKTDIQPSLPQSYV